MKASEQINAAFGGTKGFVEPKAEPTTKTFKWTSPTTGETYAWTFSVAPMTFTQEVEWNQRLATLCGGRPADSIEGYLWFRAIAIFKTVWPSAPEWVNWLVVNDEEVAYALAGLVEEATSSFREKHGAARRKDASEARFSID